VGVWHAWLVGDCHGELGDIFRRFQARRGVDGGGGEFGGLVDGLFEVGDRAVGESQRGGGGLVVGQVGERVEDGVGGGCQRGAVSALLVPLRR